MKSSAKNSLDMTRGNYYSLLFRFAIPILLGQLFQQLYNTFDTWCVGNFVGKNSFSAVGTISSIINMLIGFAGGFSTGASVVISQYFGANDENKISRAVHTYIIFTIILCLIMTVLGLVLVPFMVSLVGSPEEVAIEQRIYLSIYFAGIYQLF